MAVAYMVEVCTNLDLNYYQYRKSSKEETLYYGKTLDYPDFGFGLADIILNNQAKELYLTGESKLLAFSTIDQKLIKETSIPVIPTGFPLFCITLSLDNLMKTRLQL